MKLNLKKLFSKHHKTNEELEDEFTEQLIQENEEALREAYKEALPATVVTYRAVDDEYESVIPIVLVDNYTCKMLPDEHSIIWIVDNGVLRPFKFIRFDFMQTENMYDSMRIYIVVVPATNADVCSI